MHSTTFAILDTETTGFSPARGDKLVEVAVVKIREGEVQEADHFSSFVNPERPIPASATRVHQIVDSMVEDAPKFADIYDEMIAFMNDVDYLFIHNAKFDLSFLEAEAAALGKTLNLPKIICSVELSKNLYPSHQYHNLDAIAKRMGLAIKDGELRHRALGDVIMTGEAILKFYEENPLTFLGTLESLAQEQHCA